MHLQNTPYVFPLAVVAVISGALAIVAWRRRAERVAIPFGLLNLAVCEWSIGYLLELSSADLAMQITWAKLEYLGIAVLPLSWALFALLYARRERWLKPRALLLMALIPSITVLLALTNERHGLIWSRVAARSVGTLSVFSPSYGPWFWVQAAYSYGLILVGTALCLRTAFRSPRLYRGQAAILAISAIAPLAGNVLYLTR
ncbi:MAG: histidine kinase, partial [Chloroflexi bacterium]|nr:histidine kinase [Chloroflexota bacterium]